jgi:hypothetical protein
MAQLASDAFSGANVNPLPAPWVTVTGSAAMQRFNNAAIGTNVGGSSASYYSGVTWPNNQYSEITVTIDINSGGAEAVMASVRTSTSANTYYQGGLDSVALGGSSATGAKIRSVIAGAFTILVNFSVSPVVGDVFRLIAQGTTLQLNRNGVSLGSTTDSNITTGNAGISSIIGAGNPGPNYPSITPWAGGNLLSLAGGGGALAMVSMPLRMLEQLNA